MEGNDVDKTQEQTASSKKPILIVAVLLVVAIVAGGILLMSRRSEPQVQTRLVDETFEITEAEGRENTVFDPVETELADVRIVAVEAGSYYFEPNEINVKVGDTVRIEMTSVDMMHDLVIDDLGVRMPITQMGQTASIEFTAEEAGEYQFYCSVADHRQRGQIGKFIVE
jgi:plastocyanin